MLAVLAAVVWVVVAVGRSAWKGREAPPTLPRHDSALEALRERYARGEIDRETFDRMRRDIER
ncbi:hypothetical protein Thpro_022046 [Acidihalobacter prosperus]|uniref:SHOCT domain-containing protein n=2 Tax=Acidihalobacter prosperus TaxID=160660 RepID=A0A1A6C581_9GAMM|nr:hypothetical protein Thpro_022046 [Acidihalobacter prosperus]